MNTVYVGGNFLLKKKGKRPSSTRTQTGQRRVWVLGEMIRLPAQYFGKNIQTVYSTLQLAGKETFQKQKKGIISS